MATSIRITGLGKRKMSKLAAIAKKSGITPAEYVLNLINDDLELERIARSTTLTEILGKGHEVDEEQLDRLIDQAKARHHERMKRRR